MYYSEHKSKNKNGRPGNKARVFVNVTHGHTGRNYVNILFCRNLGLGLCSSVARVGGIIAPLTLLMVVCLVPFLPLLETNIF